MTSVLLDTSFLITLMNSGRCNHLIANSYYRHLLKEKCPMYFSSIVASEYSIKGSISDLPLHNFRIIPFNIPESIESARLWNLLGKRDVGDDRAVIRDDVKLMAQAERESIPFILTEDASTLYRYCERLRLAGQFHVRAIKMVDGFDPDALRTDGQKGLDLFAVDQAA